MKKLLYLLALVSGVTFADDFTIAPSFRAKLMTTNPGNGVARNAAGNSIRIDDDQNGNISFAEAQEVYELNIPSSLISSLDGINYFINLQKLLCNGNLLENLDVSSLSNLSILNCSINFNLISIVLPPTSTTLSVLNCFNTKLTFLNLTGFSSLIILDCKNNLLLTGILLTGCTSLTSIDLTGNSALTVLDVNELPNLNTVFLTGCSGLQVLLAKNGNPSTNFPNILALFSSPVLQYICLEETNSNYQVIQLTITSSGSSCQVNSLCTDTPGGNFNTFKGNIAVNGQLPRSFCKIKCQIGGSNLYTTTNALGDYKFYTTQIGNFTITPIFENPNLYVTSPLLGSFVNNQSNEFIGNFTLTTLESTIADAEMMIAPLATSLPNKRAYLVSIKNKGNQLVSGGAMTINFDSSVVLNQPTSSVGVALAAANTTTSSWSFDPLAPLESRSFKLFFDNNTGQDQQINFQASIAVAGDDTLDNNCIISQTQNPAANSIICLEADVLPTTAIGSYLHYMINFENQEAQPVNDIIIENTFDAQKFDIGSLEIIGSTIDSIYPNTVPEIDSHPAILDIKDNKATYSFRKGGLSGNPNGQGAVLLKIKTKGDLPVGSSVNNSVKITFDYDAPLVTNNETTTFQNLSVNQTAVDASILVYPNPTTATIKVAGDYTITSVQVYDAAGRLLQTNLDNATNYTLDISNKAAGVYFLKITSDKGSKVVRVVKE